MLIVLLMDRQAKKVRGVQTAFRLFNRIMRVPGKGELTMVELRVRLSPTPVCVTPTWPAPTSLRLQVQSGDLMFCGVTLVRLLMWSTIL